jgi:hypothetical protein
LVVRLVDSMDEVLPIALNRPIVGRKRNGKAIAAKARITKRDSLLPH